ncbi:MAG TPA: hypothetical protein VMF90_12275 [Rhizobiaceae bacterium]|nr:hypothetical protein [Rhizobiaceae bacterium]
MTSMSGHNENGITEQDRRVLFFINRKDYHEALAAKKAADAKMKLIGKQIKADLGKHGLDQIKDYDKAKTAEGQEELKARVEASMQAMRWAGVPVGTQLDLLDDRAPLDERAYAMGEEAGLRGETLVNPYNESTAEGQAYAKGWHDGQGALFAGIRKKQEAAELIKAGDESDDAPFDDEDQEAA